MIEASRKTVRSGMAECAKVLDKYSRGLITANVVTTVSLLGHAWIVWLLAQGHFRWAAVFIAVFGLMDALDGALARLQHKATAAGMLLDASTDRVKEALIYIGLTCIFLRINNHAGVLLTIIVATGSMLVSYVKAKGETALSDMSVQAKNRALQDGFARYEIRMAILIIGLIVSPYLVPALAVLAGLVWLTALGRFQRIYQRLQHVED